MHRSKLCLVLPIATAFAMTAGLALGGCGSKEKKSKRGADKPATTTPTTPTTPTEPTTPTTPPAAAGSGTITGKVAFTGDAPEMPALKRDADPFCAKTAMNAEEVIVNENKTLRNVLVRIKPGTVKGEAPTAPATIEQHDCMYRPRVQGAMADQEIDIKNGDETTHNVHAFDMREGEGEESLFNLAQPKGSADLKKDANGYQVMKFKCDVHPWMLGYIVVSDHPFFSVTGETGEFKLEKVPAGSYTLEAWHESYGMKTAQVTVSKDGTAEANFTFDAADKKL